MKKVQFGLFLGFSFGALACNSEDGLKLHNSEPNISIQSHWLDAQVQGGVPIGFWAQASDPNHNYNELLCSWQAYDADNNEVASCDWEAPDTDGISTCELTLSPDAVRVVAQVKDPFDAADLDEITITMIEDTPPDALIVSPVNSGVYYTDTLISFAAEVADQEDSPSELVLSWESSLEGVLPLEMTADSIGFASGSTALSVGEHDIRLSVTDTAGNIVSDNVQIVVQEVNERPSCEINAPQDGASFTLGAMVLFEANAQDVNIPFDQLIVEWYSDKDAPLIDGVPLGNSVPSSTDGSLSFATTDLSQNIHTISMVVTDDQGETCTDSVLVSIQEEGIAPTIDELSITPVPAYNDSTLLCTATVSDPDSSYLSSYTWNNTTEGTSIGSNDPYTILDSSLGMPGDVISCQLVVEDSVGQDSQAAMISLSNRDPNATVSVSPTTAANDELLTCMAITSDPDDENVQVSYSWTNGNQVLGSADTLQLDSSMASSGDTVTCTITATDDSGASVTASADAQILQPPFINTASIQPNPFYNDSSLTCSASVYDPNNTSTTTYSWMVNGNMAGTGSALTLNSSLAMPTDSVVCTVDITDGVTSDQLIITEFVSNRDPSLSNISITPSSPEANETVTCSANCSDDDDEPCSPSFSWNLNGVSVGAGATLDLNTVNATAGDSLICTVLALDGFGGSDSATAQATVVEAGPNPQAICTANPPTTTPPFGVTTFDGSGSTDDGNIVSYEWTLIDYPVGSAELLVTPNSSTTELVTDLAGTYTAELIVTDNDGLTGSCQVSVESIPEDDLRVEMFWTEAGDDMDLHLLPPGYWDQHGCNIYSSYSLRSEVCYFSNCRAGSNNLNNVDWTITRDSVNNVGYDDDPYLDLEDVSGVGPENINIEAPEVTSNEYVVVVHDYSGTGDPTISNSVTVNVYLDGVLVDTATKGISGEDTYQTFFAIDYAAGTVTGMNDTCSGSNSGGSGSTCEDTCTYANNGWCEDITSANNDYGWSDCAAGTDCTDCTSSNSGGSGSTCEDTCTYANDGVCDDGDSPNFPLGGFDVCATGTDCTDCN